MKHGKNGNLYELPCFEELFGWLKAPPAGSFMFKVLRREGFF